MKLKTVIHWFRRDLRLTDNTALNAAAKASGGRVVPVYILSKWKGSHQWVGANRQEFLCGCLESLAKNIEAIGGSLIIRTGNAVEELRNLLTDANAEAIYCNRDPDPFGRQVEANVEAMAGKNGATFHALQDAALHERDELLTGESRPYRVYSPYMRAWSQLPKPETGPRLRKLEPAPKITSLPLPDLTHWALKSNGARIIEPGERAARARLKSFIAADGAVGRYARDRNGLTGETTSRFSQDLRWGLLSIREIYHSCRELEENGPKGVRAGLEKFIREIGWRDFYMQLLFHYPEVLDTEFNADMRGIPFLWASESPEAFARWCEGTTGFPLVDAGMRQLATLGFMHNRLRMVVSMFLTKDLRIHWREGEAFFMRSLVDGEIASNNGGWQWSAGTGADAAPYFRIQNPWTQSTRFDPKGEFIKEYVPELRDVPPGVLHKPPTPGLRLAKDYPLPMLDHAAERKRTLEMFEKHRTAGAQRR